MKEIRGYLLADVDAVGMQEAGTAETQSLADRLGWSWYQATATPPSSVATRSSTPRSRGEGGTVAAHESHVDHKHRQSVGLLAATSTTRSTGPILPKRDGEPTT